MSVLLSSGSLYNHSCRSSPARPMDKSGVCLKSETHRSAAAQHADMYCGIVVCIHSVNLPCDGPISPAMACRDNHFEYQISEVRTVDHRYSSSLKTTLFLSTGTPSKLQLPMRVSLKQMYTFRINPPRGKWNWQTTYHGPKIMNSFNCNDLVDLSVFSPFTS